MLWLFAATTLAQAQSAPTLHPEVPSSSIAAENGPGALWVNPANLGYDPDLRWGVFAGHDPGTSFSNAAVTVGTERLGVGVQNWRDGDGNSDWSVDYATAFQLPKRVSIGGLASWHLVDGARNFVAYDVGLSWRPAPWLGLSGVAQNISSPDARGRALSRSGAGVAFRPAGDLAVIGFDYSRVFESPNPRVEAPETAGDNGRVSLRLRPTEGLFLRASFDATFDESGIAQTRAHTGLEVFFGGVGGGYQISPLDDQAMHVGWLGTDEPGESFFRADREVIAADLRAFPPYQPRSTILGPAPGPSWLDTLELLRQIEQDRSSRGVILTLGAGGGSWAQLQELHDAVEDLEAKGKPVVVYLYGEPSNGSYYVASAASKVVLHPAGGLGLTGLTASTQHMRGLLDWVGVEPQFVRQAEYKAAVESFTAYEPSGPAAEQQTALLDDLFDTLVDGIAQGRSIERDKVLALIDQGPFTPEQASAAGLVDVVAYPDEMEKLLDSTYDAQVSVQPIDKRPQPRSAWEAPSQVAVVYVEGAIVGGESGAGGLLGGPRTAGARTIVRQLEQARQDNQVKAIVLRVDSPGGSAFASDEIWRAVERVKRSGKPVVVSMGGVAASGGYYVSAGADAIWAEPTTITGSIGVFTGKFSPMGLFDTVGIGISEQRRGRYSGLATSLSPWSDAERAKMQAGVDHTYAMFKSKVAQGRDLTDEEVQEVARGRVWSGARAQEVGLVDQLGGFQDAIQDARQRAGIPPSRKVDVVTYSVQGSLIEGLAPQMLLAPMGRALQQQQPSLPPLPIQLDSTWVILSHPEEQMWLMSPTPLKVSQ